MRVHIDYKVMHVVSVLIGYRFLEKFMFSFQTLHVLCELRKFLPKISYYVANAFVSFLEFSNSFFLTVRSGAKS